MIDSEHFELVSLLEEGSIKGVSDGLNWVQFQIAHSDSFVFIDQADVLSEWSGEFCLGSSRQSSLPLRLSSTRFAIIRSSNRLLM